jgi:phospholipid/cholesterol/gamma-HCH transport system ATP-binding protein
MSQAAVIEQPKSAMDHGDGPVLAFEDVSIHFEDHVVLDSVSFQVAKGETRVLLGPAGGGKSVLLKLANGLLRPDTGRVILFGNDVNTMAEDDLLALRSRVGMVFQESALFDSLDVADNVAYRLQEAHIAESETHDRVAEALRFVELENTMQKFPSELSGGMRRRVAIARAIINKPDLLLYDSPTGGLDPITSTTIMELVVKQRDFYSTAAVLVTHRLQDAFLLATHCYNKQTNKVQPIPNKGIDPHTSFMVLNEGKLVFDGSLKDLVHSDDSFLQDFLA